ncbi:MAG: helix-turn-helix transcriptional regulator [Gloeomargarita sp. SKYBB_i_bin120]|nr:helix-turn-helix domain-containing protein [Gloeomargarita sp. SKYG98]MCS7292062.1 helix-turn-helix domain-containing protein [Gloeomargarita sp. SKYB120]MDW8177622.1 helix-turn-helix transcriptional regulator [Gloeomargarita sp. SKYBB_i_bin120]
MNIGKAIQLILSRWNLTAYRLAKLSGVSKANLSKVITGRQASLMWDDIEKLADGLRQVDPVATLTFYEVLKYPDEFYDLARSVSQPEILEREKPENIQAVLDTLLKLGITTPDLLEQAKQTIPKFKDGTPAMKLTEWISVNMQQERKAMESEDNDQEN